MTAVSHEDRQYIEELIIESDRRKQQWRDLRLEDIAEKFELHIRTIQRIAAEVREQL